MNSFKKISVNEKGVQMRKLVTAIVVATSVLTSSAFAEVDDAYLTRIPSGEEDWPKEYACDKVITEVIKDLVSIHLAYKDMANYVERRANNNILKDKDLFEQYNRQKQYLETVIKDNRGK